jgi:Uma2 family endonuclease
MAITEKAFKKLALEDPSGQWELHCGMVRQKPNMTFEHNHLGRRLGYMLARQLDPEEFEVAINAGYVRRSADRYYIPDVYVIPMELLRPHRGRSDLLEAYTDPLPLVVEIWSPSTGDYDVESKLPEYQRRGDLEIWRLHPYDRTLIRWVRQPDGSYVESLHEHGVVEPVALPGVSIDLDLLFD